jgi:GTP cyclohydrolase I
MIDRVRVALAVEDLLRAIGEQQSRPGLADTPERIARFWDEFLQPAVDGLDVTFEEGQYDEMVMLRGVPFYSLCEHHLLPFFGTATVAYIPADGRVLGLSKLARLVRLHAGKLQIQERLTAQIAADVATRSGSADVGVSLEAVHFCMAMRGVRIDGATMRTNVLLGAMRDEPAARAEFMTAVR